MQNKNDYKSYLQSEHWKNIRQRHYEDENNRRCCLCGSRENLQVHHKFYRKQSYGSVLGRENEVKNLLCTLCSSCHHLWHKHHNNLKIKKNVYLVKIKVKYQERVWFFLKKGYDIEFAIKNCRGMNFRKNCISITGKKPKKRHAHRQLNEVDPLDRIES